MSNGVTNCGPSAAERQSDVVVVIASFERIKDRLENLTVQMSSYADRMRGEGPTGTDAKTSPRPVRSGHLGRLDNLADDINAILDAGDNLLQRLNSIG